METLASGAAQAPAEPANADTAAPVETVEADAGTATTPGEGSAPSAPEAGTPEPRDKVQERIDKLTREKYDALRERDQRDYELESLRARVAASEAAQRETTQVAPEAFPTLEQYGFDEAKYQAAVAQHFSKLAETQAEKVAERKLNESRQKDEAQRTHTEWLKREADLIKSKPDYVEKVQNARTLPISPEVQQALKANEFGPQIALHLVENAELARTLMRLPVEAQFMEVGRIAERLAAAKVAAKPAVSQAPPPPSKVDTGEAPTTSDPTSPDSDKLSDAEWLRRRAKQVQRKRN